MVIGKRSAKIRISPARVGSCIFFKCVGTRFAKPTYIFSKGALKNGDTVLRLFGAVVWMVLGAMMYTGKIAKGAEWTALASASADLLYDDNIRLVPNPRDAVFGMQAVPRLRLARRSKVSEVATDALVSLKRFNDRPELDSDDYRFDVYSHLDTDRNRWRLDTRARRDSTLYSEIADTGTVQVNRPRNLLAIKPGWSRSFSERLKVQVRYSYTDVTYDAPAIVFSDFSYHELDAGLWNKQRNRSRISFFGFVSSFDPSEAGTRVDTLGAQLGANYSFTERIRGSASLGWRTSEAKALDNIGTGATDSDQSDGPLYSVGLNTDFDRAKFAVLALRTLAPSGAGTINQSDRLSLNLGYRITQKSRLQLFAKGFRNKAIDAGIRNTDRKYYNAGLNVVLDLSNAWSLRGGYIYSWQKYDNAKSSANSNRLQLTISYTWSDSDGWKPEDRTVWHSTNQTWFLEDQESL